MDSARNSILNSAVATFPATSFAVILTGTVLPWYAAASAALTEKLMSVPETVAAFAVPLSMATVTVSSPLSSDAAFVASFTVASKERPFETVSAFAACPPSVTF